MHGVAMPCHRGSKMPLLAKNTRRASGVHLKLPQCTQIIKVQQYCPKMAPECTKTAPEVQRNAPKYTHTALK